MIHEASSERRVAALATLEPAARFVYVRTMVASSVDSGEARGRKPDGGGRIV
jgi:hypothetical protein